MHARLKQAISLHRLVADRHGKNGLLVGPDPGIRWNYRVGRFVKGYLPQVRWRDDYCYLQAQGYWMLANWRLFDLTQDAMFRDAASSCAERVVSLQRADGAWDYPNPEWRGRVATVEGIWASIGLLETYRHTRGSELLDAAMKWHGFMSTVTGYQSVGHTLAVNYFAQRASDRIPNNSVAALRFLSELADVSGDETILAPSKGLLAFVSALQKPTGEMPYAARKDTNQASQPHFQCGQYNSFQSLDLLRYILLTGDHSCLPVVEKLVHFVNESVATDGRVSYDCLTPNRWVLYHSAVSAAALDQAASQGIGEFRATANRTYDYVLGQIESPRGAPYSTGDYKILSDRRSYPRYLAMILFHLLHPVSDSSISSRATGVAEQADTVKSDDSLRHDAVPSDSLA